MTPARPPAALLRGLRSRPAQGRIENFALIIGAMKAGTTTLYNHLASHPQIAPSRGKEPNFFGSERWEKGRAWYERQWEGFDPARHAWALEASTHYTKHAQHPEAAKRIAAFPARVKLLYILRDPVDRIESHVAHNIAKGQLRRAGYEALVEKGIEVSHYAHQLEQFRAAFGRPDILLLDFDDLRDRPEALLRRCAAFLGIDQSFAFPPRAPANTRQAAHGSERFRLSPEERAALARALRGDMLRLRDRWGVDVAKWGFTDASDAPRPKPAEEAATMARPSLTQSGAGTAAKRASKA